MKLNVLIFWGFLIHFFLIFYEAGKNYLLIAKISRDGDNFTA